MHMYIYLRVRITTQRIRFSYIHTTDVCNLETRTHMPHDLIYVIYHKRHSVIESKLNNDRLLYNTVRVKSQPAKIKSTRSRTTV